MKCSYSSVLEEGYRSFLMETHSDKEITRTLVSLPNMNGVTVATSECNTLSEDYRITYALVTSLLLSSRRCAHNDTNSWMTRNCTYFRMYFVASFSL